jgi:hypothetical protein
MIEPSSAESAIHQRHADYEQPLRIMPTKMTDKKLPSAPGSTINSQVELEVALVFIPPESVGHIGTDDQ